MGVSRPLVGRLEELQAVDAALARAAEGDGGTLTVVGAAGIGKSHLLAELTRRSDDQGHLVLAGSASELERDLPFGVFVDAIDAYVESLEPRRLERLGDDVLSELAGVFPALTPFASDRAQAVQSERYRAHARSARCSRRSPPGRPPSSSTTSTGPTRRRSSLAGALLRRPPAAPVLLVLAFRPGQLPARLATELGRAERNGILTRIDLAPLSASAARELLGDRVSTQQAAQLYEDSGGVPFYLEQLARVSADRRPRPESAMGAAEMPHVPPMVLSALAEELMRGRRPLRARARGGGGGRHGAGGDRRPGRAAGARLRAPDERAPALRFRHPLVRRAVYETSPAGWRLAAHERTAETLASRSAPAEAMAHHVERSARQGDASAVALLVRAGEQAAERAPGTAERWYGGALRLLDDGAPADERVEILLRRAQSLAATGRFRDGHEALVESLGTMHRWAEQALHEGQALGDRTVIAAGHATMALTGAWTGDVAKAEAARTVALGEVDALTDDELATRLDAAANLAAAELYLDHFAECGRHAERVFRVGRATGQGQAFSAMYAAASTALWMDGRLAEAGDVLDGAVDAARLIDDEIGVAWGLFNRAAVAVHAGDLDAALDMARESVELSAGSDKGMITSLGEVWLGIALLESGDPGRAVDHMQRAGGESLAEIPGGWRVLYLEHLARAHLALGDLDTARRVAAHAADWAAHVGLPFAAALADRAVAEIRLAEGDPATGAELALASADKADSSGAHLDAHVARVLAGRALREAGRERRRSRRSPAPPRRSPPTARAGTSRPPTGSCAASAARSSAAGAGRARARGSSRSRRASARSPS